MVHGKADDSLVLTHDSATFAEYSMKMSLFALIFPKLYIKKKTALNAAHFFSPTVKGDVRIGIFFPTRKWIACAQTSPIRLRAG